MTPDFFTRHPFFPRASVMPLLGGTRVQSKLLILWRNFECEKVSSLYEQKAKRSNLATPPVSNLMQQLGN
jgi:hypothetical protein